MVYTHHHRVHNQTVVVAMMSTRPFSASSFSPDLTHFWKTFPMTHSETHFNSKFYNLPVFFANQMSNVNYVTQFFLPYLLKWKSKRDRTPYIYSNISTWPKCFYLYCYYNISTCKMLQKCHDQHITKYQYHGVKWVLNTHTSYFRGLKWLLRFVKQWS